MSFNSKLLEYIENNTEDDQIFYDISNLIRNVLSEQLELQRVELEEYEDTNEREFGFLQGSVKMIKKLIDIFND